MAKSGIYKIINLVNRKIYIGSAANVFKRWQVHKRCLKSNKHHSVLLQRAWNKYGEENFLFEIIEEVAEKENLIEREQRYLDVLKPHYNICKIAGSCLGVKRSAEVKQKLSESHKGEKHPNFGKHLSEDHRQKLSESQKGKHRSEETKQKLSEANRGENNSMFGKHHSEETKRKISEILKGKHAGEKHPNCKLSLAQVKIIREKYKAGVCTQRELAEEFNTTFGNIFKIISHRTWKEKLSPPTFPSSN